MVNVTERSHSRNFINSYLFIPYQKGTSVGEKMTRKVLLLAQGKEFGRYLAAIQYHLPNMVIILRNSNKKYEDIEAKNDVLINDLKAVFYSNKEQRKPELANWWIPDEINTDDYNIDYFDMITTISTVDKLIKELKLNGDIVSIDISVGNKISSIALFFGGQYHSCLITYHGAGKIGEVFEGNIGNQPGQIVALASNAQALLRQGFVIPQIPFDAKLPYKVLSVIAAASRTINSLTELFFLSNPQEKIENNKISKAELMSMSRKVNKLKEFGLVNKTRRGKYFEIMITDKGRKMLPLQHAPSFSSD